MFLHAPGGQVDVRRALRRRGTELTLVLLAERLQLTADRSRNKRPLNRRYQGVIRPRAGLKRAHEEGADDGIDGRGAGKHLLISSHRA